MRIEINPRAAWLAMLAQIGVPVLIREDDTIWIGAKEFWELINKPQMPAIHEVLVDAAG